MSSDHVAMRVAFDLFECHVWAMYMCVYMSEALGSIPNDYPCFFLSVCFSFYPDFPPVAYHQSVYRSVPGKRPLPGKRPPPPVFGLVSVSAHVPGKRPPPFFSIQAKRPPH